MNLRTLFRSTLSQFLTVPLLLGMLAVAPVAMADLDEDIETSIVNGLAWLALQQRPDGSFYAYECDSVGYTALAIAKFEDRAWDLGYDTPLDPDYEYHEVVQLGLDYIMSYATPYDISAGKLAGDPDGDGDGWGVHFAPCGVNSHAMYQTGLALMALSSSGHPEIYGDAVQDAVDFLAWTQADVNCGLHRGGWRYNPGCDSDNSNTGYVVLGLAYAQAPPPLGFGMTIPQFVKDELGPWLHMMQDPVDGDGDDGGSWYDPTWPWVNILKTGNLIHEFGFVGDTCDDSHVQDAIDYIERHWNAPGGGISQVGWLNHRQAMFTMMKGLSSMGIEYLDLDGDGDADDEWFPVVAQHLIDTQNADGSWPWDPWGDYVLSTSWALLTLEKAVPTFEIPVPVDIKPMSCRNPFNVDKKGVMPVAILGTGEFDVTQVDPETVTLAGVSPLRWGYEDVATPFEPYLGKQDAFDCTTDGPDGYVDMTFKFDGPEVAAALGDVADGDVLVLQLDGFLKEEFGGTCIVGEDVIVILKKN